MVELPSSPFRVPFDGTFSVAGAPTSPGAGAPEEKASKRELKRIVDELRDLQRVLYAHNRYAVLCVFQALDAAGKDSTIRAVLSGINPAGFQVFSFKQPSAEELDHDFLWRTTMRLPERGRIGIFNRSYYEEVLVVRVFPEFLGAQNLPATVDHERLWDDRYHSIREHERHLARNGTVILKFWLNVSRAEQKARFLDRLRVERKQWKFSPGDLEKRQHWDRYLRAYEAALNETSRRWAPWFAIPADDKPFARLSVARIIRDALEALDLTYPELDPEDAARIDEFRARLEAES